jgi:signal transduction histidine kinase
VDGESGERTALFLNCETKLTRVRRLALISAAACGGCVLLAWLLVGLFSSRAIRPLVESAIQQKQFITDAGHELKTPLTVISANMDVLALETGYNEWIRSTRKQVANLRGLVGELVYLSRLDEEDAKLKREDVDLSRLVRETAEPFVGMAEFSGKAMAVDVQDGVHLTGDGAALERLASILCDNAVKYAPEGDAIRVALRQGKRGVSFAVENGLKQPLSKDQLAHLFDRFYRTDESRNRESGGYGIGLSVARAIVEKHGGKLLAKQSEDGKRLSFVCRM